MEKTTDVTMAIVALCVCGFTMSFLMLSMFPYAGYMVMDLVEGTTEDNVGSYAGFLSGVFMAGNVLSAYLWGKIADVYGRKFVMITSLILSGTFAVLFGTAQSFHMAVLCRFLSGVSNGLPTVVKTAAHEVSPENEKQNMGIVMGMRSWAYLVSPGIGGYLAEPLKQYPSLGEKHFVWVRTVLEKYPFLLPNLLGGLCCLVTTIMVIFAVPETLPSEQQRRIVDIPRDLYSTLKPWFRGGTDEEQLPLILEKEASMEKTEADDGETTTPIWSNDAARSHILFHWFYCFVSMAVDEAFPLFCMSIQGGLGLQEATIGTVLSGAGLLYAALQYVVYIIVDDWFGLYNAIFIGSVGGIQIALLIPVSLLLSKHSLISLVWLAVVTGLSKVLSSIFMIANSRAMNHTVPHQQRSTMNGFSTTGSSVVRSIAPFFSGALSWFAYSPTGPGDGRYGSMVVYGIISVLGCLMSYQTWIVTRASIARANEEDKYRESSAKETKPNID